MEPSSCLLALPQCHLCSRRGSSDRPCGEGLPCTCRGSPKEGPPGPPRDPACAGRGDRVQCL